MKCAFQLSTAQPTDSRSLRRLAWNSQRGRYVFTAPFEPALATHNEGKSLLRFHPNFPISSGSREIRLLGITAYAPAKPLSCGQVTARPVVDNAQHLVDERSPAKLDVSHVRDRKWMSQGSKSDLSTEAQGRTWASVYLTYSAHV